VQKRVNDLVLGTFGRGFYVLDDYSALRDITAQTLTEPARLFPLRDAYLFNLLGQAPAGAAGLGPMAGNWTAPNPPFGAVFTYSVAQAPAAESKLVLTIMDENGRQVRRLDIDKSVGLRRVAWDLRADAPPARPTATGPAGALGAARPAGPTGAAAGTPPGAVSAAGPPGAAGAAGGAGQGGAQGAGPGGQGARQGPVVAPGRYRAQLGSAVGDKVTPLGPEQAFTVVRLPQ
jgi:hypothetical protein